MEDIFGILFPLFLFGFPILAIYAIIKHVKKYQSKIYTGSKIADAILLLIMSIATIVVICIIGLFGLGILFTLPGAHM